VVINKITKRRWFVVGLQPCYRGQGVFILQKATG